MEQVFTALLIKIHSPDYVFTVLVSIFMKQETETLCSMTSVIRLHSVKSAVLAQAACAAVPKVLDVHIAIQRKLVSHRDK